MLLWVSNLQSCTGCRTSAGSQLQTAGCGPNKPGEVPGIENCLATRHMHTTPRVLLAGYSLDRHATATQPAPAIHRSSSNAARHERCRARPLQLHSGFLTVIIRPQLLRLLLYLLHVARVICMPGSLVESLAFPLSTEGSGACQAVQNSSK
jgi:hypothetical protein